MLAAAALAGFLFWLTWRTTAPEQEMPSAGPIAEDRAKDNSRTRHAPRDELPHAEREEYVESPKVTVESAKQQAQEVVRRLAARFPNGIGSLNVSAWERKLSGKSAEAAAFWTKCLELDPRCAEAFYGLGFVAVEKGDAEEAVALARKAIRMNPSLDGAAYLLATALTLRSEFSEAAAVLEKDAAGGPRSADACCLLGESYLELNQYEKAVEHLKRAVELAPQQAQPYYMLATACARLGRKEDARQYREKFNALRLKDGAAARERMRRYEDLPGVRRDVATVCEMAGHVYLAHGEPQEAENHWKKAAWHHPEGASCRRALADLYERQNRLAEAVEVTKRLIEIDPGNPAYRLRIGSLHAQSGQFEAAESAFQQARRLRPRDSQGHFALASLYLKAGRNPAEALSLARTAVERTPSALNYVLLASACGRNGDLPGAVAAMREAVQREPGNQRYRQEYERLLQRQKQP